MRLGRGAIGLIVLGALLCAPATSFGAQVFTQSDASGTFRSVGYLAGAGETNRVSVTRRSARAIRIDDPGALLVNGLNLPDILGCTTELFGTTCTAGVALLEGILPLGPPAVTFEVSIQLGDKNDRAVVLDTPAQVDGGAGNDAITLRTGGSMLGGPGADTFVTIQP